MREPWNRCENCGRFFSYNDVDKGKVIRVEDDPSLDKHHWEHRKCVWAWPCGEA